MATILQTSPDLITLNSVFEQFDPDFLTRLSLFPNTSSSSNPKIVYLAPSNAAFSVLPDSAIERAIQPSNYGASRFLLTHGLGEYDEEGKVVRAVDGFNITVKDGRAGNARVEKRVCAENGCLWAVGRWVDPLF